MDYYTSIIIMILLALGVLSVLIYENNRISQSIKQLFMATNILIALAAIAECVGVHISGNENLPKGLLAAVKAVDYTLTPMTGGALLALMQKQNTKNRMIRGLFIGNTVIQIVSAFNGWMVLIDDQHRYTHGPLYPLYMAFYSLVIIILAVKMISYGKSFRKHNRKSLYAIMIFIFIGIGVQEVLGQEFRVSYLALTFGVIFLFIHYSEFSQLQLDDKISEQQVKISNDALTGVLSRFAYVDAIHAYASCIPTDFAAFLLDINGLKAANDSMGHEAGDELICGAAQCIEKSVGKNGQTFRIGGDEFVVFTTMTKEQADASLIDLKNLTSAWSGKKIRNLSVSAGYALAKDFEGLSIEELVKEADKAMYEQKKEYYRLNGHNRRSVKEDL